MKYIYGPVQSRRLGTSLGVSLTPYKMCDFDCIYCQLGETQHTTIERKEHASSQEIIEEVKSWFVNHPQEAATLQFVTLSGLGEPTLHSALGGIIAELKKITTVNVAVITNASLLADASVRQALLASDLIVPSLDAAEQTVFETINRPHQGIKIEEIIAGLQQLRRDYRGQIWLEVMLVKGVNDSLTHARKLAEITEQIRPQKIQLNSPVRTTAHDNVLPVGRKRLEKIKEILGEKCEII